MVVERTAGADVPTCLEPGAPADPGGTPEQQLAATRALLASTARALRASEERFRLVFHHGPMAMCALDAAGVVTRVNPALRRLLSLPSDRLLGEQLTSLVAPADRDRVAVAVAAAAASQVAEPVEVRLDRLDGARLWCEVGVSQVGDASVHALVTFIDIDDRKAREGHRDQLAAHDAETGLATRAALAVVLGELLAPQEGYGPLTLLRVDVHGVRGLDEGPGDEAGDAVLVQVAGRLRDTVRPGDVVARLGPECFAVLCHDLEGLGPRSVRSVVRRLHRALSAPVLLPTGSRTLGVQVAVHRARPGEHPSAVLSRLAAGPPAALAPHQPAARRSGDRAAVPPPGPARLLELVDTALSEDRLTVRYQPVVDLRSGAIIGAEALLRMHDRDGKLVLPDTFIPLAEASGAIHALGDWVLRTSCVQVAAWKRVLPPGADFAVGVNLSPRQLDDPYLLRRMEAALDDSGLDPAALVLELTERLLTTDTAQVRAQLDAVRDYGVHLAADDFGTGYASLRYLLDLPIDTIKIDRSWTTRLGQDSPSGRLAAGVVRLAVSTGLTTIVEGVETEQERTEALRHGLVNGQGYLFGQPLTVQELQGRLLAG